MSEETERSIRRMRRKGWSLEDIAVHHALTVEQVRTALGMGSKPENIP